MRLPSSVVIIVALLSALGPAVPGAQDANELFNGDVLQRIELRVNSADWEKLKQNFDENTYYPADVVWNGITVRNCGIRSRGFGSRSGTKPGLRVDANRYVKSQTAFGVKSFILDNLVQDSSAIHETTAMRFFERMGIPAPREAHARLFINGRYSGLYAVVESVDKDFLARIFGSIDDDVQNDGFLYDYEYTDRWLFNYLGDDLEPYKLRFDAKTHEERSAETKWRKIEELVRLVNDVPSERFMEEIDPRLDLRAFIRFVAVQNFLAENDGFLGYDGMNNFYFYRKENSDQHVFIAWDDDNAFVGGHEFPLTERHDENVLFRKAMEVRELNDLYYETLDEASRSADERDGTDLGWLESVVRRQLDRIADSLSEDTFKPYSMDEHARARSDMINFARERIRFVRDQLRRE